MKNLKFSAPGIPMRIPNNREFDLLMDVTHEDDSLSHWKKMHSWVNDKENKYEPPASRRAVRGYHSARRWHDGTAATQSVGVGFRPAIDLEPGSLPSDIRNGDAAIIGTLYMNGMPVRVPQNPTWGGDITDYIPGAKLEMRPALDDPSYQVTGIYINGSVIADRNLVKRISYTDIQSAVSPKAEQNANTKIEYQYRDASNWKVHNEAIVSGPADPALVAAILACLDEGEYFIPSVVGLPENRFDSISEDDHPWFELGRYSFSSTTREPTVNMSLEELATRFKKAVQEDAFHKAEREFNKYYGHEDGSEGAEKPVIVTAEKFEALKKVLTDNGIDPDEADTVAQAVCYVLTNEETEQYFEN